MIAGVIFDLDGVLVSTDAYHFRSWQRLCNEEGFTFFDYEFNHKFRGVARMRCVDILLEAAGRRATQKEKEEIATRKNAYFVESLNAVTPADLLPGATETLLALRDQGVKTAVASNSRNAKLIIEKVGIGRMLDVVVDGYDIVNSKPDPEAFLLAARRLGLPPSQCLVVEDAVAGIEAADAAGMKSVGIGRREYIPNARVLAGSLAEISIKQLLEL